MIYEEKILFMEENPILLRRAVVFDDGYFLSLTLCPCQESAIPGFALNRRYSRVVLYRRRRSFWSFIFLSPLGFLQKRLVAAAVSLRTWWSPVRILGYLKFRVTLVLKERYVKGIAFSDPPSFKFIWADSENGVAVLLNGEPWAFVCERGSVGYSKGLLRSEGAANTWDRRLFEQIFSKGE
jgi:hypothetical protein